MLVFHVYDKIILNIYYVSFLLGLTMYELAKLPFLQLNKIHLWRHSIVLALHYFQGMACYRSATLLEVMDTRSFFKHVCFL